jgi:aspartate dehydrogenase
VTLHGLAEADIVVEAAPAAVFEQIASAAIEAGRIFVPASVGALLPRMHLVRRAQATGARIVVPTGALLGLDAVQCRGRGRVDSIAIESRKPPRVEGAPYLVKHRIDVSGLTRHFASSRATPSMPPPASPPTSTLRRRWRWPASARRDPRRDLGGSRHRPHAHDPRGGRGGALHHDDRERAECGEPACRADHRTSMLACLRGLVATLKVGT